MSSAATVPSTGEPGTDRGLLDRIAAFGAALSAFTERWIPDAWVICLLLTVVAFAFAVFGAGVGFEAAVLAWGGGMWSLNTMAMQFSIVLVASYACVTAPPIYRLLDRLRRSRIPSGRGRASSSPASPRSRLRISTGRSPSSSARCSRRS